MVKKLNYQMVMTQSDEKIEKKVGVSVGCCQLVTVILFPKLLPSGGTRETTKVVTFFE